MESYALSPSLESELAGDDMHGNLYAPDIFVENGLYMMWYGAQGRDGHDAIHLATSSDGFHWKKYGVVIETGQNNHVNDPSVVKVNGTYYMYYTVAPVDEIDEIWVATSLDGFHWDIHGKVIGQSIAGWDSLKVGRPSVLFMENEFKIWFDGMEKDPVDPTKPKQGTGRHVGYATSVDGLTWEKWLGNPIFNHSGAIDVEYIDGRYVVVEESGGGVLWRVGNNETSFDTHASMLFQKQGTSFDQFGHVTPFILLEGGTWVATYTGAATWSTWNRNRISTWYPILNVTAAMDGSAITPRWAASATRLKWSLDRNSVNSQVTMTFVRGMTMVDQVSMDFPMGESRWIYLPASGTLVAL